MSEVPAPPAARRGRAALVSIVIVLAVAVVAATSPASDRSVGAQSIGPIGFDPADEQIEGVIQVGAIDGRWDRVVQTFDLRLDPTPDLARVELLDADGTALATSVFEDGEASVTVQSDCAPECTLAEAYRVVADGDEELTLEARLETSFDSDLDSDLDDVDVELPSPEVALIDEAVGFTGERPEVDVDVSPGEPVGGALVTLGGTWCSLDTIEIVALSTPPSGPDPVDPQVAQIVGNQGSTPIAHEQVVEVPISCQGDSAEARSFWLTVAGAGATDRSVRFVLSGDAPADQVDLEVAQVDEADQVDLVVGPDDGQTQVTDELDPGPTSELTASRLLFAEGQVSNPFTIELEGPLSEVFTTSALDLGVIRLAVGPCPPADCEATIPVGLRWLYPGSDEPPVEARFTLWSLDAQG